MVHKTPQSRVLFGRANVGLLLSLLVTLLVLVVTPFVNHPQLAEAATTSSTINFQARLLQNSGAVVPDGNYHVEFKLYDTVASGGSAQGVCSLNSSTDDCWWVETRTTGNLVRVVNGYLTVNLGSLTAFGASIPWDRELWLTMNIGGTSGPSWDGEMSPRIKLTAVPYAFRAAQLVSHNGTQTGTLAFGSVTNSPALTLPNETGTVCTNAATGACTATGGFVQLQSATPGTQQTGNLNISGTGILGTQLQTPAILAPAGLTIQATGTNTLSLNTTGAGTLNLGTSNTTVVGLGNTGAVLTVEGSSAAGGIIIGNGATNHGIQIGTSSSGDNDIVIGSTNSGSTISLEGGTAANSIAIGNAATAHNIAIGNASGANNTVVGIGSGTTGGSNTSVITIGSANAANSTLLLQGGNNTGAVSIQAATSGTISIGTTNNNPINIGSTSTNSQINIGQATGANSNTIAIGATIGNTGTQTINLGYNSSPTAGSTTNVNIGSTIAGTTAVQGATTVTNRTSGSADTLVVSNNTSTGTIALFKDNSSVVLQIADGGGAIFTNQTNSATAFQIQNATNADQLFTVDTTARGAGGGNLIKIGNSTGTDTATTVLKLDDSNGALSTNLAALNGGLYYNSAIGHVQVIEGGAVKTLCNLTDLGCASTTLQNAYDNDANGGDAIIPLTSADGGIIIRNPVSSGSGSTYNLVLDQLATGANGGLSIQSAGTSNLLLITDTTSTARDVLTIADTGITTFRNQTDSTAAFKVQNAAGTNILNTDTTNQRVVIGSNQTNSTGQLFLAGFANPVQVGSTQGTVPGTSLSGMSHVAVQGRYAYAPTQTNDSLVVIDVSNPAAPLQIGEYQNSTLMDGALDVAVAGKYAYVTANLNNSLAVIDVSNPTNPTYVKGVAGVGSASYIVISGRYAYVTGNGTLYVIDISNPISPAIVGSTQGTTPGTSFDGISQVKVQGRYAYITAENRDALAVVDVSNPAAPVQVGEYQSSTNVDGPIGVVVSGRYAYVAAEASGKLAIIDISNPAAPAFVASVNPGGATDLKLAGRYAYVGSFGSNKLSVVDISNPSSPSTVGSVTSLPNFYGMDISGRYLYGAERGSAKLDIFDLGGIYSTSIEAGSVDTTDLRTNTLSVQQYATFNSGLQASGGVQITGNLGVQGPATFASDTTNNTSGSKIGFQIQDANAGQILNVNTTSLVNLLSNTDFEGGNANTTVPGWAKLQGAETTFATVSTQAYYGADSLNVVTAAATANQGAKYIYQFKPNTNYVFSIYAKHNSGSMATFDIGANVNSSNVTCSPAGTGLTVNTTWSRQVCAFTTGTTTLATDYVYVRNSSTTSQNFYLDGAMLQQGMSLTPYVNPPSPNLINNSSLETGNYNGWLNQGGSGSTLSTIEDTAYSGKESLKFHLSTSSTGDTARYPIPLLANTTYTLSLYARTVGSTATDFGFGYNDNGDTDCSNGNTLSTSAWSRYSCTFTTVGTIGDNPAVYVWFSGSGSSRDIYLDGFQLETASAASVYQDTQNNLQVDTLTSTLIINGSQNGEIQPWRRSANNLPTDADNSGGVIANGYIYSIGGYVSGTPVNTVYYAKINTDGSVGAWNTTTSYPTIIAETESVFANGYIYSFSGSNGSSVITKVYSAKVNQDGTLGAWKTNPIDMPFGRAGAGITTHNGYVYIVTGTGSPGTYSGASSTVYYAKLNADGTTGPFNSTNGYPLGGNAWGASVVSANGYLYILGGQNSVSGFVSNVYSAPFNADGSLGTFITTLPSLPLATNFAAATVMNGYIYLAGVNQYPTINNYVYYAKLNADGTIGNWQKSANNLPGAGICCSVGGGLSNNGYFYVIGGDDFSVGLLSTYYTSTARIQGFGSLDLVGLSGQNLAEGNTGGQLTAGNTSIIGTLNVQDQASFSQSVSVQGDLNAFSHVNVPGFNNPVEVGESGSGSINVPKDVEVQGRYAYVLGESDHTFYVWDVSNPTAPYYVSEVRNDQLFDNPENLSIQGKYAYVVTKSGGAQSADFVTVDISNPSAPTIVGQMFLPDTANASDYVFALTVVGRYAYVVTGNAADRLIVIDVSNPIKPVAIATTQGPVANQSLNDCANIVIQGKYAYISCFGRASLAIMDISNPYAPAWVSEYQDNTRLDGAWGLSVVGRYAYVSSFTDNYFTIIDVSNPAAPTLAGSVTDATLLNYADNNKVVGHYAYVTTSLRDGVTVIDVSNPAVPVIVGEARGWTPGTSLDGATGIDVSGRYAYVTAQSQGQLVVLDLGGTYSTSIESGSVDTTDLRTNSLSVQQYATFNSGLQASGGVQITGNLGVQGPATFASDINSQTNVNGSKIGFQIQDANAGQILNVNTTSLMNLLSNGSFENGNAVTAVPGWAKLNGAETTFQTATSQFYYGATSLNIQPSASPGNQGGKYVYQFKPYTSYNFSVYARVSSTTMTSIFDIGARVNGSDITCVQSGNSNTVTTTWARYYCAFTTGGTTTTNDYVFVRDSAAGAQNFFIDGAMLQYSTRSTANVGTPPTPYVEPPSPNLITNHSIESNTNGWTATANAGSSMGASRDVVYSGQQSLKFALSTATSNDKITYSIPLTVSTTYTFSFYSRLLTGSATDMTIGYQTASSDVNSCAGNTLSNSVWTRYTCSFTTSTTAPDSNTNLFVKFTTSGASRVAYFDGFQLETAAAATPYYDTQNNLQVDTLTSNITINGSQNGDIQAWRRNANNLPGSRWYGAAAVANGYVYYVGGGSNSTPNATNTVYYAKLNTDGSTGAFSSTTTLPANRVQLVAAYLNGYIYALGGGDGAGSQTNTVYYAKVNQDGTLGTWLTNAVTLPATSQYATGTAYDGYLYIIAGRKGASDTANTWYVKPNADGSLPSWLSSANGMPGNRKTLSPNAPIINGYVYVTGGDAGGSVGTNTVYYSKIDAATGNVGTWNSTSTMPNIIMSHSSVALNGYLFVFGWDASSGVVSYYAKANSDGTLGTWRLSSTIPFDPSGGNVAVVANGYILRLGGNTGGTVQSAVYYTSGARTTAFGSLDLVGLSGQNLAEGNSGGSLTAGNTSIVGSLNVQDQAAFAQSVSVAGDLNAFSHVNIPGFDNPVMLSEFQGSVPGTTLGNAVESAVQGKYAYVASQFSTSITVVDVSNPANPVQISQLVDATNIGSVEKIIARGRYAYIVSSGSNDSLTVIDISNPNSLQVVGTTKGARPGVSFQDADALAIQGRYAYVVGGSGNAFSVVDISNPYSPKEVATMTNGNMGNNHGIVVDGNYAYVTNYGGGATGELVVVNISNPLAPTYVTRVGNASMNGAWGICKSGRYVYVTAEIASPPGGLTVFDVSNPATPTVVSTILGGSMNNAEHCTVDGHYLYVSTLVSNEGLYKVDISNPAVPVVVGRYQNLADQEYTGPVTISGRYAYVTDWGTARMFIYDLGGTYSTGVEAGSVDANDVRTQSFTATGQASFGSGVLISGGLEAAGGVGLRGNLTLQADSAVTTSILHVNTSSSNMNLVANGDFEQNVNGWFAKGSPASGPAYEDASGNSAFGRASLTFGTNADDQGIGYYYQFVSGTAYTVSFWAKASGSQAFAIGSDEASSIVEDCTTGITFTTTWTQFSCALTISGTVDTKSNFFIRQVGTGTNTVYIDGVTLIAPGSSNNFSQFTPTAENLSVESVNDNVTINGVNSGEVQPWQQNSTSLGATTPGDTTANKVIARQGAASVTSNGYMYVVGGYDGTNVLNSILYAKMNADGSLGNWSCQGTNVATSCGTAATAINANALPAVRRLAAATVANGYIYAIGGVDATPTAQSTIYYAKLNGDGSTGTWQTNAYGVGQNVTTAAGAVVAASVVTRDGFIYTLGGCSDSTANCGTAITTTNYAKLYADGGIGPWTTTTVLPAARGMGSAAIANGFVYYLGGASNSTTAQTTVYAAPVNTDGTIGAWNSGITPPTLPLVRTQQTTVVANGYIYVLGGCNALTTGSCTNAAATTSTVYYAKLNPTTGNLGAWNTGSNALPAPRAGQSTAIANGYIYVLGGYDGAARAANVLYSSTSRVLVGGSLDLVGLSGGSLSDYSGAGALTAGNGRFIGDLKVDGFADFNNGISVDSAININAISANSGQTVFNINNTNSNSIFNIRHMSTNFGSLVSAGAFMAKNSYWAEEYNIAQQGNVAMTGIISQYACAWARGDTGGHVTGANATCSATVDTSSGQGGLTISANLQAATTDACTPSQPAGANGTERITATAVNTAAHSASCMEYPTGGVTGASSNFLTATNLPVMTMKIKPSTFANNTGIRVFAGMWSGGKAPAAGTLPGTAASTWGVYFTNCSATTPTCANTTLRGWVVNASTTLVGSVSCPTALSTTNYAYLRIEFRTATEVHFYADVNTADGINEVECGTGVSSGSINAGAMTPFVQAVNSVNATGATTVLDVDYLRTWQDDNVDMSTVETSPGSTNTGSGQDGQPLQTLPPLSPESADPNALGSFFNFNAATSEDATFNHNVFIKGTLYVDKIRANEIEGLSVFTDKLSSLQAELAARAAENGEGSNSEENSDDTSNVPLGAPGLNLGGLVLGATTVNFDLNVEGALTIGGDANFHGNVFFYKLVTFVEKTVFNNDITLKGHLITDGANPDTTLLPAAGLTASNDPNANLASVAIDGNDTNGLISITLGDNATPGELVKVSFKRPYTKAPRLFLTASSSGGAQTTYLAKSTADGFTVVVDASQLTPGNTLKFNYWAVQNNLSIFDNTN